MTRASATAIWAATVTLHPAGVVNAIFPDRDFANSRSIPQGFGVTDWGKQGLMFEGGSVPLAGHSLLNNLYGEGLGALHRGLPADRLLRLYDPRHLPGARAAWAPPGLAR